MSNIQIVYKENDFFINIEKLYKENKINSVYYNHFLSHMFLTDLILSNEIFELNIEIKYINNAPYFFNTFNNIDIINYSGNFKKSIFIKRLNGQKYFSNHNYSLDSEENIHVNLTLDILWKNNFNIIPSCKIIEDEKEVIITNILEYYQFVMKKFKVVNFEDINNFYLNIKDNLNLDEINESINLDQYFFISYTNNQSIDKPVQQYYELNDEEQYLRKEQKISNLNSSFFGTIHNHLYKQFYLQPRLLNKINELNKDFVNKRTYKI